MRDEEREWGPYSSFNSSIYPSIHSFICPHLRAAEGLQLHALIWLPKERLRGWVLLGGAGSRGHTPCDALLPEGHFGGAPALRGRHIRRARWGGARRMMSWRRRRRRRSRTRRRTVRSRCFNTQWRRRGIKIRMRRSLRGCGRGRLAHRGVDASFELRETHRSGYGRWTDGLVIKIQDDSNA